MNVFDTNAVNTGEDREQGSKARPAHYRPPAAAQGIDRLAELEIENARLNRLVAELLIKNQQLRRPDEA
jgi:hypothetical protein